jgi:hypothetical protein
MRPPVRTIALLVPVTSRGRTMTGAADADFLRLLLPSFLTTATFGVTTRYRIYLGYDAGDPLYDRAAIRRQLTTAFRAQVGGRPVTLMWRRCEGMQHAPVWVWNALFRQAFADGCDFFYQVGDDVVLETPGWARDFAAALLLNPLAPGLGVTGPRDGNKPRLTQSFVSRAHMQIFGTYFPSVFRNWWSDDWLTEVYRPAHLRPLSLHLVANRGGVERYRIDRTEERRLADEIARGKAAIAAWLARPRLLPARFRVIGFSLWDQAARYTTGAVRNAELARELYPGWVCRFYVGTSVPRTVVDRLAAIPNVELVGMRDPGDWRALLWRFLPATDERVDVLVARDTDSRLSLRERAAVDDWLASDRDFHIMRDHPDPGPDAGTAIAGGLWGVRRGLLWNMRELIARYQPGNRPHVDREFLRVIVHPLVRDRALVHDERHGGRPFPTVRRGDAFVGQRFDEHDRPD